MILDKIIAHKRREVECRRAIRPLAWLAGRVQSSGATRSLRDHLRRPGKVTLMAEIKRASPSKGWLVRGMKPVEVARIYTRAGAAAISILTDSHFFRGHRLILPLVRRETSLPLLYKDFIIDPYQIYEARYLGADAILLIVAALDDRQLSSFQALAAELGLSCLVEVHTAEELERARASGASIIGINNRDLRTFSVDLSTTFRLREKITDPGVVVVSESGINSREHMMALARHRVDAALVGEALVKAGDMERKVKELLGEDVLPWSG